MDERLVDESALLQFASATNKSSGVFEGIFDKQALKQKNHYKKKAQKAQAEFTSGAKQPNMIAGLLLPKNAEVNLYPTLAQYQSHFTESGVAQYEFMMRNYVIVDGKWVLKKLYEAPKMTLDQLKEIDKKMEKQVTTACSYFVKHKHKDGREVIQCENAYFVPDKQGGEETVWFEDKFCYVDPAKKRYVGDEEECPCIDEEDSEVAKGVKWYCNAQRSYYLTPWMEHECNACGGIYVGGSEHVLGDPDWVSDWSSSNCAGYGTMSHGRIEEGPSRACCKTNTDLELCSGGIWGEVAEVDPETIATKRAYEKIAKMQVHVSKGQ